MRIHALQTGTVQIKQRQRHGLGPGPLRPLLTIASRAWTEPIPILAWAIEHPEGVIVVDCGETARTQEPGYFPRWQPFFSRLALREQLDEQEEIGPRLRHLGIEPARVLCVVLTHLHTDHAGGLHHFEGVEILVSQTEHEQARGRLGEARGYLPRRWPSWFSPTRVSFDGPPVGPFESSHALTEHGDVLLLPTPGHTRGHLSVLVRPSEGVHYLLAGDASYTQQLMLDGNADGVTLAPTTARDTLARLKRLVRETPTVYLPTHDPDSPRRLDASEPAFA